MDLFIYVLLITLIIVLILIIFIAVYNKYQSITIRLNKIEKDIDDIIRERYDLLESSIDIVNNNTNESDYLNDLNKLKNKEMSNFLIDRELVTYINKMFNIKNQYPNLNENTNFISIYNSLLETDDKLEAYKNYYNDNITKYNKLIRVFPTNIVGILSKQKEKTYLDGKDMSDDITNDFKL